MIVTSASLFLTVTASCDAYNCEVLCDIVRQQERCEEQLLLACKCYNALHSDGFHSEHETARTDERIHLLLPIYRFHFLFRNIFYPDNSSLRSLRAGRGDLSRNTKRFTSAEHSGRARHSNASKSAAEEKATICRV
jgi:hypothetical protein